MDLHAKRVRHLMTTSYESISRSMPLLWKHLCVNGALVCAIDKCVSGIFKEMLESVLPVPRMLCKWRSCFSHEVYIVTTGLIMVKETC